jgi:aspartate/methionine/tyrosine aminotransferase
MKVLGSPYIEWIKGVELPRYNLGMSGMSFHGSLADLGLKPKNVPLTGFNINGLEEFKSALSKRYGVAEKNILLNIGTSGANFLLFSTLFEAGDKVLVERPVYDPIPFALRQLGIEVIDLPRRFENGYQIDESEFKDLYRPEIKAAVLTNLHNPSGVLISDEKIRSVSQVCAGNGGYLIIDEIYLEFYFGRGPGTAFHLSDNIIVTSRITKAFGLGGLRAGWCFAPEEVIGQAQKLYNLMGNVNPYITEFLAAEILSNDKIYQKFSAPVIKLIEANLPLVENFIRHNPHLEWVKPDGGISCFPRTSSEDITEKLCNLLMEQYSTLIIPGKFFFQPESFRLSFGLDAKTLLSGLDNINEALKKITGKG